MKREWVDNILRQCRKQGTRFFFKQWGGVHKSKTGRLLDGRKLTDEFPEAVHNPIVTLNRSMHDAVVEA